VAKAVDGIRWPEVIASAVVFVGLVLVGLYFHSYEPKGFSAAEVAAAQKKALVNCGYSMFDVEPKSIKCPAFDTIRVEVEPCFGPDCPGYSMTLHANGKAELEVSLPAEEQGTYEGSIDAPDFRRLSNLLATLALDRRGGFSTPPPDVGVTIVRAGCRGEWAVVANHGGEADEVPGYARCLADMKSSISWDRK
jgi:hypothetical protein